MNRPEGISPEAWSKAVDLVMNAEAERVPYYAMGDEFRDARLADATAIAKAIQAERAVERARCVAICELWLLQYGNRGDELEHTSAQEWANGAVQDIAEHIRKGA